MKNKILLSIAKPDADFEIMQATLAQYADVSIVGLSGYSLKDVDIFIGKSLTEAALDTANRLKIAFAYKTGVDDFPTARLFDMGVTLCNSHVNSEYIARYAFSLALALTSRIPEFDRKMRRGDWDLANPCWTDLFGMKVGIVGYGSIGVQINKLLRRNNIETFTIDRHKQYEDVGLVPNLEELCRKVDLIMIALPRTPETDRLFNADVFRLLKGKYIVNVGRSNCIDEPALYSSLKNNELAGAAIDTWREKPTTSPILKPFDCPFDALDNIVLSSHKAMQVRDGHGKYVADTLDNVIGYLNGNPPRNVVDLSKGY